MLCALNEGFFVALYLLSFSSPLLSPLPTTQNLNSTAPYTELSSRETILANPHSAAAFELRRANKMVSIQTLSALVVVDWSVRTLLYRGLSLALRALS